MPLCYLFLYGYLNKYSFSFALSRLLGRIGRLIAR